MIIIFILIFFGIFLLVVFKAIKNIRAYFNLPIYEKYVEENNGVVCKYCGSKFIHILTKDGRHNLHICKHCGKHLYRS